MAHTKNDWMTHRWLLSAALLLLSCTASASGTEVVRKQVEASLGLTGTIEVSRDGSVQSYVIDKVEKLPEVIVKFVHKNIDSWKFEPVMVDGKAVAIRNNMSMLVVAKKQDDGQYLMRLQAANFYPYKVEERRQIASKTFTPPNYPEAAIRNGVTGTVYLVLKIGRDGKVQDAIVEQVNLRIIDSEHRMQRYRGWLADASLEVARKWEFSSSASGEQASDPFRTVRVPLDFLFQGMATPKYGEWQTYVPGPRQRYPWAENEDPGYSPEALTAGSPHIVDDGGLRLLTPLGTEG